MGTANMVKRENQEQCALSPAKWTLPNLLSVLLLSKLPKVASIITCRNAIAAVKDYSKSVQDGIVQRINEVY